MTLALPVHPRRSRAALLLVALAIAPLASCQRGATAAAPAPAALTPSGARQTVRNATDPLSPLAAGPDGASLPEQLEDSTWWRMVQEFSEPGGYFRSENFVSNEMGLQYVVAKLRESAPPGGVYVGVGPEQNFTYIAALNPRIAFVVDIRRQNLLQHLWYKAVFELSPTRAQFLARLFGRPLLAGAAASHTWSSDSLMSRLEATAPDSAFFRRTFEEVRLHLTGTRGLTIDSADLATLRYVDSIFFASGPGLNYSSGSGGGFGGRGFGRGMPSFSQIARATDPSGNNVGFLGTEQQYQTVRDLERRNLVIPVVGNFSGPKALRAVGGWLRARGATVNVFYTSNVEQYLWQQGDDAARFYANVGTMPVDAAARFIRSSTGGFGMRGNGFMMTQLTSGIGEIVQASAAGTLGGYGDVLRRSVP
jgi:hypothetical protein